MADIDVDVLVIGWGKGGKTLAGALGRKGRNVALVEQSSAMYGGSCINIACIPTKDLVHSASERRPEDDPQAWFESAVAGRDALTDKLRARNHAMLAEVDAVTLIDGRARFTGPHDVEVTAGGDTLSIRAETIIINTGTEPAPAPFPVEGARVHDSTSIQHVDPLPERLVVVALEHRDEQGQRQEGVGAEREEGPVVVPGERGPFRVVEGEPRRPLVGDAAEQPVGLLGLPPRHGADRVLPVALDERRVAVDGEEELVDQIPTHRRSLPGTR